MHSTLDLIARDSIPWVSALKGATVGVGFEIASATHIRVADETTLFALPEAQRGSFVGGAVSVNVQRLIGYARMADMMLTGRVIGAREAERINAVRYVVPAGESLAKATELAHRIMEHPPLVNWAVGAYLQRTGDISHDDGMFAESLLGPSIRVGGNTDRIEAFLAGRAKPLQRRAPCARTDRRGAALDAVESGAGHGGATPHRAVGAGVSVVVAPRAGLRVIDVANWLAAPAAAGLMADMGADVITIEPPTGDSYRFVQTTANPDADVYAGWEKTTAASAAWRSISMRRPAVK